MEASDSDIISRQHVNSRDRFKYAVALLDILKCPATLGFLALFIVASFNHIIMQYCSLLLIVFYVIVDQIRHKRVRRRAALCVLSCLFLIQMVFLLIKFDVTTLNLSLIFLYLVAYISIYWNFVDNFEAHQLHRSIDTEPYIFLFFIMLIFLSLLLGDFSVKRFSGPFQNVLNFTGIISIVFSLYVAFYGTSGRALILAFCVLLIGISCLSKILILLVFLFLFIFALRKKHLLYLGVLFLICLSLVKSDLSYEIIHEIRSSFSLHEGPIVHRLERYANLLEFNVFGIPMAHPTVCSKTMSQTCLTSESFLIGFVLVYGLCGLVALSLVFRFRLNLRFLPMFAFFLLTGGFFTPSAILAAWTVFKLQEYVFRSYLRPSAISKQA